MRLQLVKTNEFRSSLAIIRLQKHNGLKLEWIDISGYFLNLPNVESEERI